MYPSNWKKCWIIILAFEFKSHMSVEGESCRNATIRGIKCLDCSHNRELDVLLAALDSATVECLDISNTSFTRQVEQAIQLLLYLTHLIAINVRFENHTDVFLKPLIKLEYLNLTNSTNYHPDTMVHPAKLKVIDYTNIEAKTIDLHECHNLEVLNVSNNEFNNLPIMSDIAPLKEIIMDSNPLDQISTAEVAKYCTLKKISIKVRDEIATFKNKECECVSIKLWAKEVNMTVLNLGCDQLTTTSCHLVNENETRDNRKKCLDKQPKPTIDWVVDIIIAAASGAFLLLFCVGWCAYRTVKHNVLNEDEPDTNTEEVIN